MSTKQIKAVSPERSARIDRGAAAAATKPGTDSGAPSVHGDERVGERRGKSGGLLDQIGRLAREAAQDVRRRPLAVFGTAFAVGLLVAGALRRRARRP